MADLDKKTITQQVVGTVVDTAKAIPGQVKKGTERAIEKLKGMNLNDAQIAHLEAKQGDKGGTPGGSDANVTRYAAFGAEMHKRRQAWEDAVANNKEALKQEASIGTTQGQNKKNALDAIHKAQREYFALIECAVAESALDHGIPRYLSTEEWETLAGVTSKITDPDKRKEMVEKYKADNFAQYRGIISKEQFDRATQLVQGESLYEGMRRYWSDEDFRSYLDKNWFNSTGELVSFSDLYGEKAAQEYMVYCSSAMHLVDICYGDTLAYSKHAGNVSGVSLVAEADIPSLKKTFDTLAAATQYDYHDRATRYREYRVRQGARSKYGEDIASGVNDIGKTRKELLQKLPGNENGPPFIVNGVEFSKSASVAMYQMRMAHVLDIFQFGWGAANRTADVEHLVKAWVEATADANKLKPSQVLTMYASGEKVTVEEVVEEEVNGKKGFQHNKKEIKNENFSKNPDGSNGPAINAIEINNLSMVGGLNAALAALAEKCVLLGWLQAAYNVNLNDIQSNQPQSEYLRNIAWALQHDPDIGWAKHEVTHIEAARKRLAGRYGIGEHDTPEQIKQKVMARLFDQDLQPTAEVVMRGKSTLDAGVKQTGKSEATATGVSPSLPPTPPSSSTPPSTTTTTTNAVLPSDGDGSVISGQNDQSWLRAHLSSTQKPTSNKIQK